MNSPLLSMISGGLISHFEHANHFNTLAQVIKSLHEEWSSSPFESILYIELLTFESLSFPSVKLPKFASLSSK